MKQIIVYVEGRSDKDVLEELLKNFIYQASQNGDLLSFYSLEGKKNLLLKGPKKAVNILRNSPESNETTIFIVPDLYPPNIHFPHTTYEELKNGLEKSFHTELEAKGCSPHLKNNFKAHCFKFDLEVLLLASEDRLKEKLRVKRFSTTWKKPVEDQNHGCPPKRVIETLFKENNLKYKDTIDAPLLLGDTNDKHLNELKEACPQNFKPFINDLLSILQLD